MAEMASWVVLALVELAEPARGTSVAPLREQLRLVGVEMTARSAGKALIRSDVRAIDEVTAEEVFFQRVRSVELARSCRITNVVARPVRAA